MSRIISPNEIASILPKNIFVIIASASFEDRCLSVPLSIPAQAPQKVLLLQTQNYPMQSDKHAETICARYPGRVERIKYSASDPFEIADALLETIQNAAGVSLNSLTPSPNRPSLVFDISTFPREVLLIGLQIITKFRHHFEEIHFIYNPAIEMDAKWLSEGVKEIRILLGLPGAFLPLRPLHLVLMAGFEIERARAIITRHEPAKISIGTGKKLESIQDYFFEKNNDFANELLNIFGSSIDRFEFSLIDPEETKRDLANFIGQFDDYNTLLVPLNNKISTIGAGLYALEHSDIQICYAEMLEYNVHTFSKPDPDRIICFDY